MTLYMFHDMLQVLSLKKRGLFRQIRYVAKLRATQLLIVMFHFEEWIRLHLTKMLSLVYAPCRISDFSSMVNSSETSIFRRKNVRLDMDDVRREWKFRSRKFTASIIKFLQWNVMKCLVCCVPISLSCLLFLSPVLIKAFFHHNQTNGYLP